MSTRATILIESVKDNERVRIYHHHDGYLEGVGEFLREFLKDIGKYWSVEEIVNRLIKHKEDRGYEYTSCVHGDEEYFYLIDCDNEKLKYAQEENSKTLQEIVL